MYNWENTKCMLLGCTFKITNIPRFHSLTRLVSYVLSVLVVSWVNVMTLVSSPGSTIFKFDVSTLCLCRESLLHNNHQNGKRVVMKENTSGSQVGSPAAEDNKVECEKMGEERIQSGSKATGIQYLIMFCSEFSSLSPVTSVNTSFGPSTMAPSGCTVVCLSNIKMFLSTQSFQQSY